MSTDKKGRIEGDDWWAEKVPTLADLEFARAQVAAHGGRVDIVISHTAPLPFLRHLPKNKIDQTRLADPTVALLDKILGEFHPKQWFFGHFHLDAQGYDHVRRGCTRLFRATHRGNWRGTAVMLLCDPEPQVSLVDELGP
jgi:hypothetical protein